MAACALADVHYVDVNSTNATPPYTNWTTAATNIQDAVDAAVAGDEIVVNNLTIRRLQNDLLVVLLGMPSTAISIRIPTRILEQMPAPGNGRRVFIVKAIEEKLARRRCDWKPRSERGKRMAALLTKGQKERTPLLPDEQLEQELNERRGRRF